MLHLEIAINKYLVGISRAKAEVCLDKPISVGFAILELSKVLMYDFYYNTMKHKYDDNLKLLFTDTDSLCYAIETDVVYKDMYSDASLYDFSEYSKTHDLYDPKNKKVIG